MYLWKSLVSSSVFYCQCNTLYWVFNVYKTPCLTASTINCYGIVVSYLGTKPVQNCPVITVYINPVNQNLMHFSFLSADSPNYALVQFSDFKTKVFLEVKQSHIVQTFCHMVNTARVVGMNNLNRWAFAFLYMITIQLGHAVSLRYCWPLNSTIPINAHRPQMNHVTSFIVLHNRDEDVFCWLSVVSVCVVYCFDALHRVRRCPLLSQVHNYMRIKCLESSFKLLLVTGNVKLGKSYSFSCKLFPLFDSFLNWSNRRDAAIAVF